VGEPSCLDPRAKTQRPSQDFWIETSIETCTGIRVPGSLSSFFAVAGFYRALRCSGKKERKKKKKKKKKRSKKTRRRRRRTTTTTSKKKRGRSSRKLNEIAVYFWTK
jgi:hypothetical protein